MKAISFVYVAGFPNRILLRYGPCVVCSATGQTDRVNALKRDGGREEKNAGARVFLLATGDGFTV